MDGPITNYGTRPRDRSQGAMASATLNIAKNPVGDIKVWGGPAQPVMFPDFSKRKKPTSVSKKNKKYGGQ